MLNRLTYIAERLLLTCFISCSLTCAAQNQQELLIKDNPETYLIPLPSNHLCDNNYKVNDDYTVCAVEQMPEFPGGMKELTKYFKENLQLPDTALKSKVAGIVFVSFLIGTNGSITDIAILKGIGYGCDQEAVRVIQMMPRWKPATQNGSPTPIRYSLPVRFSLPKE